MTYDETAKILMMSQGIYPHSYSMMDEETQELTICLWQEIFQDYPFELVNSALKEFIMTSGSDFAPNPGQLNDIIVNRLKSKVDIMDPADAWTEIERVMRSSDMHYEPSKAFKSLPKIVQKAIGSTSILREWSLMHYDKLVWVKKDFLERLKELQDKESKEMAQPQNILRLLSGETVYELPDEPEVTIESKPMHINDIMSEMFGREQESLGDLIERLRNAG